MDNKVVTVFMICMFLAASINLQKVEAAAQPPVYVDCYSRCRAHCLKTNRFDDAYCDLRCENYCDDSVNTAQSDDS